MGVKPADPSCFPSEPPLVPAHEGLLEYDSKRSGRKERWFALDAASGAIVKCDARTHQRSRNFTSTFGRSGFVVAAAQSLSGPPASVPTSQQEQPAAPRFGVCVTSKSGETARFYTKTAEEEAAWLAAIDKLLGGLAHGVSERLARRELLAGKYSLVRELGRGASGVVSLYTWQGKPFAVKKFLPKKSSRVPNRRAIPAATGRRPSIATDGPSPSPSVVPEDVRREIALLKKASSLPYVVALHDVILDCEHNDYYLVMEYMGGGAIAEWDGERRCYVSSKKSKGLSLHSEDKARTYLTNLVVGIQALHANRLCHRDIKPENLIANEDQTLCKIADLGVAHYFKEVDGALVDEQDADSIELSSVDVNPSHSTDDESAGDKPRALLKTTKGTYQFLPPEALSGDAFDGFKADVWAIGVTMYALLFGFLPFFSTDVVQLFDKIERDDVCFPAHCRDDEAKDLLRRILEKDPEKRISLDAILQHAWMNRAGNAKAVKENIRALQRSPALRIEDSDVGSAVSVLQARFEQAGDAVRRNRFSVFQAGSDEDGNAFVTSDLEVEYRPQPIDMAAAEIPSAVAPFIDAMAAQLHFEWCQSKLLSGWRHGSVRSDEERLHPCLVPMRDLDDAARLRNLRSVEETIKGAITLGCRITPASVRAIVSPSAKASAPFPTDQISLPWDLMLLVDLLAENAHEVWAAEYAAQGWRFGRAFDQQDKTHPSMRPYMALDEPEKELTRAGVASVMKACVHLGFRVSCASSRSERMSRRSTGP